MSSAKSKLNLAEGLSAWTAAAAEIVNIIQAFPEPVQIRIIRLVEEEIFSVDEDDD